MISLLIKRGWRIVSVAVAIFSASASCLVAAPIQLHPDNGRYFLFRERPTVLVGSSEHYGALVNLDFDYLRYLDEKRACGLNYTRIFSGAYVETQGAFNIEDNTLATEPGRSILPWARSETPGAADGGNKYDLTRWNPAYFFRLRDLVREAGTRGIVVELTLFSPYYDDGLWGISALNGANNINGVGISGRVAAFSASGDLLSFQKALARKCLEELREFDNVIIEICNEPYMGSVPPQWESEIIGELAAAKGDLGISHLIAQNVFSYQGVVLNPNPAVSLFNFHYAKPEAALANLGLNRALGHDETGFAGKQDFTYRSEAWEFMFAGGALFNHLDYSFTAAYENGIASPSAPGGGGPGFRRQMGILRWFMEELPLVALQPQLSIVKSGVPQGGGVGAIGVSGEIYAIYVRGGTGASLTLTLPEGTYRGYWMDPQSGLATAEVQEFSHGGGDRLFSSPSYVEDAVLRLDGGPAPKPRVRISSPGYNRTIPSVDGSLTISADAMAVVGDVSRVEFFEGENFLQSDATAPYEIQIPISKLGKQVLRAKVVTADGREAHSQPVKVRVVGDFVVGVNLNGEDLTVDGDFFYSESGAVQQGMIATNTRPTSSTGVFTLYPAPESGVANLLQDHVSSSTAATEIGLDYPLPDGRYDVFLFVVEGQESYSRDMKVTLENRVVATGIGDLAKGNWHKYGPYRVEVTDGNLDIGISRHTKGTPKIAGFSIYQAPAALPRSESSLSLSAEEGMALLSYPEEAIPAVIETSSDMGASDPWRVLEHPASELAGELVTPVPVEGSSRFFRLRMD